MTHKCYCAGACNLARPVFALLQANKKQDAYQEAKKKLEENPACARLHIAYGTCLMQFFLNELAEWHLLKALEIDGENEYLCTHLAVANFHLGKLEQAKEWYARAANINPNHAPAIAGTAKIAEVAGEFDKALSILASFKNRDETSVKQLEAQIYDQKGEYISALNSITRGTMTGPEWIQAGRIQEKLGNYENAWECWETGNRMQREMGYLYNEKETERNLGRLKDWTKRTTLEIIRPEDFKPKSQPIFICGFPRSGTTMIEQSLSMHPDVTAGDELPFINLLCTNAGHLIGSKKEYPECLSEFIFADKRQWFRLMRLFYMDSAERMGLTKTKFFTDKMPINELHIPLIHLLFPHSPILYVRRHPLDIIVSAFSHYLSHGNNQSFAIESAAHYYVEVDKVVKHYQEKVEGLQFYEIKYENFIESTILSLESIFLFCNMKSSFDTARICAAFHNNKRHARTASYAQVKRPVYQSSVGRYKSFLKWLGPVLEVVRPICEREGYEI